MRTGTIRIAALAAAAFFSLASCVDLDSKLSLKSDGSGTLNLVYRVSALAMNLGGTDKDQSVLPLPVGEADFRRTVQEIKGLELKSYSSKDDVDKTVVTAELEFTDLKALSQFLGAAPEDFSMKTEGGTTVFSQVLFPANKEPLNEKTKDFFTEVFKDYGLRFTVKAPSPIRKSSRKDAEVKGSEATLRVPLLKAVDSREPFRWDLEW